MRKPSSSKSNPAKLYYFLVLALSVVGVSIYMSAYMSAPQAEQLVKPRKVYAFYYPWYGNPQVVGGSGIQTHWEGINVEKQSIANSTNYPSLGAYDSHDVNLIDQHTQWARAAGIDGLIVSWWGKGSFEDRALDKLLEGSNRAGLEMTVYYEKVRGAKNAQSAAKEILALLYRHGDHPAWMRHEGKPVVFIYGRALHQIGMDAWREVRQRVNMTYPGGAVLIGDSLSRRGAQIFDGIHTYNTAGILKGMSEENLKVWATETYPNWVGIAKSEESISTVTVIPGYDDTKERTPGIRVARFEGRSYREQWQAAIAAKPDWILITSWNEWHEGSEIEPSAEHGDAYLKLTAEFATSFKGESFVKLRPTNISEAALDGTEIGKASPQ